MGRGNKEARDTADYQDICDMSFGLTLDFMAVEIQTPWDGVPLKLTPAARYGFYPAAETRGRVAWRWA